MFLNECFKVQLLQFEKKEDIFDIGKGKPFFSLNAKNWYLGLNPITIVADPFLFVKDDRLFLFYESKRWKGNGVLCMTSTSDLKQWSKPLVVLKEPFHLSFPWVFKENGHTYMIPETGNSKQIRLYEATDSSLTKFVQKRVLMQEPEDKKFLMHYGDNCIYKKGNYYYLYTQVQYEDGINTLELYVSEYLMGPYIAHPLSPIQRSMKVGRNAGSLLELDGKLYRFSQDCTVRYGDNVNISEVIAISPTEYSELVVKENIFPTEMLFYKEGGHQYNVVEYKGKWIVATDAKEYHLFILQRIFNKLLSYC